MQNLSLLPFICKRFTINPYSIGLIIDSMKAISSFVMPYFSYNSASVPDLEKSYFHSISILFFNISLKTHLG